MNVMEEHTTRMNTTLWLYQRNLIVITITDIGWKSIQNLNWMNGIRRPKISDVNSIFEKQQ